MRLELREVSALAGGSWSGAVLCRDVLDADGRPLLAKGRRLTAADAPLLASSSGELHLLWLDPEDVDEDTAAVRLAQAVAGPGVEIHRPVESQVRLSAARRGIVRVDAARLVAVNAVEGVTVFTVPDGVPVDAGCALAGVKVTPLALPEAAVAEAEGRAAGGEPRAPPLSVAAFRPLRLSAVVRQRIDERSRMRFERSLRQRAEWFGGSVQSVDYSAGRGASRAAIRRAVEGADLVLVVGVASVDPLESTWQDLLAQGAAVIRRGLPVHPGSSYWLARLGEVPVIGVASRGMLSRRSALDLLHPLLLRRDAASVVPRRARPRRPAGRRAGLADPGYGGAGLDEE